MEIFQTALFKLLNNIDKIRKHWESMTDEEPQNTVSTDDVEEEKTTFQSLVIITFLYLNSIYSHYKMKYEPEVLSNRA